MTIFTHTLPSGRHITYNAERRIGTVLDTARPGDVAEFEVRSGLAVFYVSDQLPKKVIHEVQSWLERGAQGAALTRKAEK